MEVQLIRADQSGVFALPDGKTTDDILVVLLNGKPTEYTPVKDGTEVDVPESRFDSIITAILK